MATLGGPASNVVVDTSRAKAGGPALPVAVVTDGRAVEAGPAIPVYVVTGGPIQAGPAVPVVAAPAGSRVEAGPAIPVYVVAGVLGATAPVNTVAPSISGTRELAATLTTTNGTWLNSPTSYAYQWYRNGVAIGGATTSTYVLTSGDLGKSITAAVTAANAAGSAAATSSAAAIPNYALDDLFTTAQAAPLTSPRSAEPGPGTLTITDTTNKLSISGGRIVSSGNWAAFDPKVVNLAAYTRANGRAFRAVVRKNGTTGNGPHVGVALGASGLDDVSNVTAYFLRSSGNLDVIEQNGGFSQFTVGTFSASVDNEFWLIMRSIGWFYIANNVLQYVGRLDNATVYDFSVRANQGISTVEIDTMQYIDGLGGAWASDYGIATDRKATTSAGDTIVTTADAFVEHTFTAQTGITKNIKFRYVDDDNCLICRCDQGAGTIKIFERAAGVETEKTGGTTTMTWSNGTSYRVSVRFIGTEIRSWVAWSTANNAKNNTTSGQFSTATMAKVDHAGTNLVSYPTSITVNP